MIVYENEKYWINKLSNFYYEVYKKESTHSKRIHQVHCNNGQGYFKCAKYINYLQNK